MHGGDRGPVRVRVCCAPFTLLRLLTLHCTRRRGAAEGEGAQQTEKGAADAKACRRRPGAVPRGPRATRSIRPRDRVRGDRRRPRRRHRTDAPCRSSWIRIRPPPVVRPEPVRSTQCATASTAAPGRPAGTAPAAATDPTWSHSPRRRPGGGSGGARRGDSSHRYGDDRHDARLLQDGPAPVVRRRSRPALRCGSCAKTPGEGGRTPEPAPAPEGQATGQPRDVVAGMLPTCDVASALRA